MLTLHHNANMPKPAEEPDDRLAKAFQNMNEQIVPDEKLVDKAIAMATDNRDQPIAKPRRKAFKGLVLAAALLCCVMVALPALAAESPIAYQLLYAISPATAQFFTPVQQSSTDQGIRMEVDSVYVHGDTAEIYIALQDLTGNRVDATTDLFDSERLLIPFDSIGTCRLVDFDPETNTALFLANISTMDGRDLPRGKVTFRVGCFISGKTETLDVPIPFDPALAAATPKTQMADVQGGSIPAFPDGPVEVLAPGEPLATPSQGFAITAMGYIDGTLHVQLQIPHSLRLRYDYHGFLTMKDAQNQEVPVNNLYFGNDEDGQSIGDDTMDYVEYLFDVPPQALSGCTLYGSFYGATNRTDGDWQVTFPLTPTEHGVDS